MDILDVRVWSGGGSVREPSAAALQPHGQGNHVTRPLKEICLPGTFIKMSSTEMFPGKNPPSQ